MNQFSHADPQRKPRRMGSVVGGVEIEDAGCKHCFVLLPDRDRESDYSTGENKRDEEHREGEVEAPFGESEKA